MKNKLHILVVAIFLICSPKTDFAQAPSLGAAKSFSVFTAVGAVSNVGTATGTEVWGDVGTNAGAFTAFPPGILHGSIHVADFASASAAAAVNTLYGNLAGATCDIVLTGTLGGGAILAPGVYCKADATILNGELILDGQGDANALFIFQINGTFTTGATAQIIVINSASLCNVFWQVNGEFTLGPDDIFRGSIVANGAIHLLEGSVLRGRALSISGAIDMHNNPVIDISGCDALPVNFSSFMASRIDPDHVQLKWITVSEVNNNGFFVEKDPGNNHWEPVSFIPTKALGGNSSSPLSYIFNDLNISKSITQYRIKQVDLGGRLKFSEVRAVRGSSQEGKIIVYPNPSADGRIDILFADKEGIRDISLTDMNGRVLKQWKDIANNTLRIESIGKGVFFLKIVMRETGNQRIEKIFVSY